MILLRSVKIIYTMNKTVKKLMKDAIIRNWTISLNYSTMQKHTKLIQDTSAAKNAVQNNEILVNNIKNIIENVTQRYEKINERIAVKIINAICEEVYTNKNLIDYKNFPALTNLKEFEHICTVILHNCRCLSTYNTINVLKNLLFLKISSDSVLIQTLLQLIRTSLNNLSIKQIMILYHILYKVERTPLSMSLLSALIKTFKSQAQIEHNLDDANLLEVLRFCSLIKDSQTIIRIIRNLNNSKRIIDLNIALDLFDIIYALPELCSSSKKLLFFLQHTIDTNCKKLNFYQIKDLLHCISTKFMSLERDFYSESFVNNLCSVVLNNNTTLQQNLIILKYINEMRHSNIPLLHHLVEQCIEDTNALQKCSTDHIDWFIDGFVIADYKLCRESLTEMLQNFIINSHYTIHDLISVTFRLLSLNCYCPEVIEKVFNLCNNEFVIIKEQHTRLTMLKLYWCIKLLYPQYKGVKLDENILNRINIECESYNEPYLMGSLMKTVGGFEYMKSCLKTKFGKFVDYVIVIQSDGSFMNISNYNVTFVEELASLSNCSKILFFVLPIELYSTNSNNMLSTMEIQLKAIETLSGFYTFAINSHSWKNFSDIQRMSYFWEAIKSKCINIPNK